MICALRRRIYGRDPHELSDRICKKEAASALVVLLIPAAALLWRETWYEVLARYVGAAIYGH